MLTSVVPVMDYSDILSWTECVKIVKICLHTSDFDLLDFTVSRMSENVMGFLGEHLQVRANVFVCNPKENSKKVCLQFFAKTLPKKVSFHTNFVLSMNVFDKEVVFYSSCSPHLVVTSGWAPKCFLTRHDLIVLEDLSVTGFQTLDRRQSVDFQHCEVMLITLARFHAATFIFEEEYTKSSGNTFRINHLYPELFEENLFVESEKNMGSGWFTASIKAMLSLVELLPKYGKDTTSYGLIQTTLPRICLQIMKLVKPSKIYRNVVSEGDLWTNNVMFRYQEKTPVEARLVDFQLTRYAPPAHDIAFFMHTATSRAFRVANTNQLLHIYHCALTTELQYHGLDVQKLLPWVEFQDSYQEMQMLGRIVAPAHHQLSMMCNELLVPYMATEDSFTKFMTKDRDDAVRESFLIDDVYRQWLTDDLEELIECCILSNESNMNMY